MSVFLRMYQALQTSLLGTPLSSFSGRLPKAGMMRSGSIYARRTSVRPTAANAGSAWPTARTAGLIGGSDSKQMMQQAVTMGLDSCEASQMAGLSIPTDWEQVNGKIRNPYVNDRGAIIDPAYWPKWWPTPARQDGENTAGASQFNRHSLPLNTQAVERPGQALNPDWVEMLMGYPPGWTNIDGPPDPDRRSSSMSHRALRQRGYIARKGSRRWGTAWSRKWSTPLHAKSSPRYRRKMRRQRGR